MRSDRRNQLRARVTDISCRTWALLLGASALIFAPTPSSSEEDTLRAIPLHAHIKDYGPGWECDRGYQLSKERTCVAVEVPENAFLAFDGRSWRCHRGYKKQAGICASVELPDHAHLSDLTRTG